MSSHFISLHIFKILLNIFKIFFKGTSARNNNPELNQINGEKRPTFENNVISLTPQDIRQLKNLISMYNGHILSYHQSLVSEKHSDISEQDLVSSEKLNNNKQENIFKSVDSIGKSLLENKVTENCPTKVNDSKIDLSLTKSSISLEKVNSVKNHNSEKSMFVQETRQPEVATLNLFEIVKEDLLHKGETISRKSKKHRSKHTCSQEKQKSKNSSKCCLISESSSKESIPIDSRCPEVQTVVNVDSGIENNFLLMNNNEGIIHGGGDAERITRYSNDLINYFRRKYILLM